MSETSNSKQSTERKKIERSTLVQSLKQSETHLLLLQRRYHFLKDYFAAIDRDLGDAKKAIPVRNDIIQHLVSDCYDMLVNDLVSFCEGITQKGGLLELMKSGTHHFKLRGAEEFNPPVPQIMSDHPMTEEEENRLKKEIQESTVRQLMDGQKELLLKMFPKAKLRKEFEVTEKDINLLIIDFKKLYKTAKECRDNISAHRYEKKNKKKVALPSIEDLGKLVKEIESLMNQIRVILENSSFGYTNFFHCSTKETAKDLLDMAVCGWSLHIQNLMNLPKNDRGPHRWQLREAFYEKIRQKKKIEF